MKDIKKLKDMLDAIEAVEGYSDLSYGELLKDPKTQDAIMFNLVVLGEAANRISDEFKMDHQGIPWSSIIGTRNVIVHGYDQVRLPIIWDIIQKDIKVLKENILDTLG
jgi:uncharacterized protein with HEPN domain